MPQGFRFIFLGTGTSAGVPTIGCSCAVCTSTDPRDQRLRTGAAVLFRDDSGHPRTVLIDATPDLRQQALRYGLCRCDAIVFTHNHVDHTFGLDEVRRFNAVQRSPVHVYAEEHTLAHLRRVYQHIFEREQNINDSFVAHLVAHRITPPAPIELFGLLFTPIRLLHGRLPVVGFRIEVAEGGLFGSADEAAGSPLPMAYCTDVSAIPPEAYRHLRGLRVLVLDGLRHRKHPTHLSIDEATRIAEQVEAGRTYFTHMAHEVSHAQTEDDLPENIHLAYDGLTLGAPEVGPVLGEEGRTD